MPFVVYTSFTEILWILVMLSGIPVTCNMDMKLQQWLFFFLKLSVLIVGASVCFGLVAMIWITKGPLCGVATTQPWISTTGLQWSPIVTLTTMIVLWSYTQREHGPILAVLPKFHFSAKKSSIQFITRVIRVHNRTCVCVSFLTLNLKYVNFILLLNELILINLN